MYQGSSQVSNWSAAPQICTVPVIPVARTAMLEFGCMSSSAPPIVTTAACVNGISGSPAVLSM